MLHWLKPVKGSSTTGLELEEALGAPGAATEPLLRVVVARHAIAVDAAPPNPSLPGAVRTAVNPLPVVLVVPVCSLPVIVGRKAMNSDSPSDEESSSVG